MNDATRMADREHLQQLVVDYANAIDRRDWHRLDRVFTPAAYIDYRVMGGIDGRYPQIKAWLQQALAPFAASMHLTGNFSCEIAGDRATGSTACFNPMVIQPPGGAAPETMFFGLWYDDEFVRTPGGWRIAQRVTRRAFDFGVPEWLTKALKQQQKA